MSATGGKKFKQEKKKSRFDNWRPLVLVLVDASSD